MNRSLMSLALTAGLTLAGAAFAQAPAAAPSGSTGLCKDGSYTSHDTKKGACSGHKGVKEWYAAAPAAMPAPAKTTTAPALATAPTAPTAAAPATGSTMAPPAPAMPAKPAPAAAAKTPAMPAVAAAGGGAGQVWVNASTKVYHCAGTKYYGKTKQGEYMTEAAAKAAGNHADHGKACS